MSSTILDDLLAQLPSESVPVRRILVGQRWIVVCSRHAGMAAALGREGRPGSPGALNLSQLHEKSAQAVAALARSTDLLEASIGVAAINSLIEVDESLAHELNAVDVLAARGKGKTVVTVGHFPFTEQLRSQVGRLWVIEQHPQKDDFPAEAADDLLPKADVIAITASALINHTLDGLLLICAPASTVVVLGPSTPLSPVLFDHGAHILSGARVQDEAAVVRTVAAGGSFRQVEGVKLLTLFRGAPA